MFQSPDSSSTSPSGMRRVLVVDDEPTLRLGFSYALQNSTTQVDTAGGGAAALELIGANHYDALFLDFRMPDIDGLRVIEILREAGNAVPIVLCSAFVTLESALAAIRHRVVDFLLKPVSPADLRHALDIVTGVAGTSFAKAMECARKGRFEDGIGVLAQADAGERRALFDLWCVLLDSAWKLRGVDEVRSLVGDRVAERIALRAGVA